MKKIYVHYWYIKIPDVDIEHGAEYDYTLEKQNEITDMVLSKGYQVMMLVEKKSGDLWIWIDNGIFRQR